jgi:metal-responsive CopG/Arc/MetJ family transcriptional regulator
MRKARTKRVRITVSLPADLVRRLDRKRRGGTPRSRVVEALLEESDKRQDQRDLDAQVEQYYRKSATEEDDAIAKASGRAARRLRIDDAAVVKARQ